MSISISLVRRNAFIAGLLAAFTLGAAVFSVQPAAAAEAAAPGWEISSLAVPTNFVPGETSGGYRYEAMVSNIGAAPTDGSPIKIVDTLPAGVVLNGEPDFPLRWEGGSYDMGPSYLGICQVEKPGASTVVTCTVPTRYPWSTTEEPAVLNPGEFLRLKLPVAAPASATEGELLLNEVEVEGGGALSASTTGRNVASSEPAERGFAYFQGGATGLDGQPVSQAGAHPFQYTFNFAVNTKPGIPGGEGEFVPAGGDVKDVRTILPAGVVGNATSTPRCSDQQFVTRQHAELAPYHRELLSCPDGSAIGYVSLSVEGNEFGARVPLYNLVPPRGEPAQFGFPLPGTPASVYIDTEVQTDHGYRIVSTARNNLEAQRVTAVAVTVWGNPADGRHDPLRGSCVAGGSAPFPRSAGTCSSGLTEKPFWRLPTSCGSPLDLQTEFDTWNMRGSFVSAIAPGPVPTGCDRVPFEPALEARPTTLAADSPTGLHADLQVPQPQEPEQLGEADVRDTVVTLPQGIAINPSSANGLDSCSEAQVGYLGKREAEDSFSGGPASCPANSEIGTAEVDTPLIDHPLPGSIYVATPNANPFGSLLAIYVVVDDPQSGVVVKLAGHVEADSSTGRLRTTFAETPQMPFEHFRLDFFGGPGATLRTPQTCGHYSTEATITPWSGTAPISSGNNYSIAQGPDGSSCPLPENSPSFEAGTVSPAAGAYSPLVMRLRREDGTQEFGSVTVSPPPGLLAKLAGVPYCPDSALATAATKTGRSELASPSCPGESSVGTVEVAAGAGPHPFWTQGSAYLAGPYNGAPLSLAVVTPAVAGPYDLGTVVVRVALRIDPVTAQVTAVSDSIPHILQGIPLDIRAVNLKLTRFRFTVNPTNCSPLSIAGTEFSATGEAAPVSQRFQVGECGALGFKPKLDLRLFGKAQRGAHPRLRAILQNRAGDANIARTRVALPHSEFLDQSSLTNVCTRVQYQAGIGGGALCPKNSRYGWAKVWSPLLAKPLTGGVFLRSNGGEREVPDLIVSLNGQIHIDLVGYISHSNDDGIVTTFAHVPDAPVSKFMLVLNGGKHGLIENSDGVCSPGNHVGVNLQAHSGKERNLHPSLRASCGGRR